MPLTPNNFWPETRSEPSPSSASQAVGHYTHMLLVLLPSALGALLQTTPAASRPHLHVQHSRVRRLHATAGGDGKPQVNQEKVDGLLRALSKADGVDMASKGDKADKTSSGPLDGLKEEWGRLQQGEGVSCSHSTTRRTRRTP